MSVRDWLPSFGEPVLIYREVANGIGVFEVINLGNRLKLELLTVL